MIKTVLLICFLIIATYFCGRSVMLFSGISLRKSKDFFSSFSAGSLAAIILFSASHILTVIRHGDLTLEKRLTGIVMLIAVTAGYFAFLVFTVKNAKSDRQKKKDEKKEKNKASVVSDRRALVLTLAAIAFSVLCFLMVLTGSRADTSGDETLETVAGYLAKGKIFEADPLTGSAYAEGIPMRHAILGLPGFYGVLSSAFSASPEIVVLHILPAYWFLAGLCSVIAMARSVFKKKNDASVRTALTVIFSLILIFATDLSVYSQGYGVLGSMWTGYAIRTWVLIPFMLFCLFEKKYIIALLPVACEALICRTMYGVGFCACIYVGLLIVDILGRRFKCLRTS